MDDTDRTEGPQERVSWATNDGAHFAAAMRRTELRMCSNLTRWTGGKTVVVPAPVMAPAYVIDIVTHISKAGMVRNVFDIDEMAQAIVERTGSKRTANWVRTHVRDYVQGMAFGFYPIGREGQE